MCQRCEQQGQCTQNSKAQKTITRHVWEGAKEEANKLRLTKWGKKVYARFRGLSKVQMQCLLAATAQNMKKMALLALLYHLYVWLKASLEAENSSTGEKKSQMMGL